MAFQNYALYPHLTVFDNIAFPLRMRADAETKRREVERVADIIGLRELLDAFPGSFGGQRQRVAMGRAIIRASTGFPVRRAPVELRRAIARADADPDPRTPPAHPHDHDLRHP